MSDFDLALIIVISITIMFAVYSAFIWLLWERYRWWSILLALGLTGGTIAAFNMILLLITAATY